MYYKWKLIVGNRTFRFGADGHRTFYYEVKDRKMNTYTARLKACRTKVRLMIADVEYFAKCESDSQIIVYTLEDTERILQVAKSDLTDLQPARW